MLSGFLPPSVKTGSLNLLKSLNSGNANLPMAFYLADGDLVFIPRKFEAHLYKKLAISITSHAILRMTLLLSGCSANFTDEAKSNSDQADHLRPTTYASTSARTSATTALERLRPTRWMRIAVLLGRSLQRESQGN